MQIKIKNKILLILLTGLTLGACGKYSKVTELPKEEVMKKNERVYGNVGGPARQSLNTYPDDPDLAGKSAAIRNKIKEAN